MNPIDLTALPWAELFPMPYLLIACVLCPVLGFVYGYQHPEGS